MKASGELCSLHSGPSTVLTVDEEEAVVKYVLTLDIASDIMCALSIK